MNYFEKFKQIFTEAANDSDGLKEGGSVVDKYSFPSKDQLAKEGRLVSLSWNNTGFILPTEVTAGGGPNRVSYSTWTAISGATIRVEVPPGEAWLDAEFMLTVDRPCFYDGYINQGSHITQSFELGGFQPIAGVFGPNGGERIIKFPKHMNEGGVLQLSFKAPGTVAKPVEQPIITLVPCGGVSITNDYNYSAKRVILSIGDSISWAGERIGYRDNSLIKLSGRVMYDRRIADALVNEGKSVRVVKKGFGSMTQMEADRAFENGWYDGIDYDLLICNRGTNDVPASITGDTETAFKTSLKKVILGRNKFRPNASIIFIAPFPSDSGATRVANLATVRTWVQDVANDSVLGTTARKVYFYNGGTAFTLNETAANDINFAQGTATVEGGANTAGERSTGNRLHLGEYGHLAAFNGLWPVVQSTHFYQNF